VQERTGVYRVLVGKHETKIPLGRPWHRWDIILRWIFGKLDVRAWIGSSGLSIGTGTGHF